MTGVNNETTTETGVLNVRCEEIDYAIHGNDLQVVEVELDPGETVIAEAGAMNWMDDHIEFEAKNG